MNSREFANLKAEIELAKSHCSDMSEVLERLPVSWEVVLKSAAPKMVARVEQLEGALRERDDLLYTADGYLSLLLHRGGNRIPWGEGIWTKREMETVIGDIRAALSDTKEGGEA